ncbi:MAG: dihydrodipicolinate synthase family protein [Betaproteobacteria bacterium RIFCSPLOWO2_12_FULL_66_14]|nr:MAG: dihydrodipicolinate synthase family protein [Betaproteobacteria bacterium RIFCSPLOWO2_12_FULL_66_14]
MNTAEAARLKGILAPAVTPFHADLSPDVERYLRHCTWLLANGCSGLAVFGTNSEANSLSAEERMMLLEQLVHSGIAPSRLMPGTGCCALSDTVRLTAHAVALGCAGVLMLPPFYYKDLTEEGLYRSFSEVIERAGNERLRVYLYHIPPVAHVGIPLGLIERLLKRYPGTVAGIKDSSGDWNNTQALLSAFRGSGFDVFAGSEAFLLQNMRSGGVGCITATGNVNPAAIDALYRGWEGANAHDMQADIAALRAVFAKYPMIAALKAAIASYSDDPGWAVLRPPLVELTPSQSRSLVQELHSRGFTMPGLAAAGPNTAVSRTVR